MPNELQPLFIPESIRNPNLYQKFGRTEVFDALTEIGYGPTKMYVDSFYLSPDERIGVGVLSVTEEHTRDHFGLLRGVDQAEASGQVGILIAYFSGKIPEGQSPLLMEITGFKYDLPVVEEAVINVAVMTEDLKQGQFRGTGQILLGETVLAHGAFTGAMAEKRALNILIARRRQIQGRTPPLFPPLD